MASEARDRNAIECPMSYALLGEKGEQSAGGECKGTIDDEYLTLFPKFGDAIPVQLREIEQIDAADYRIVLSLSSRERLTLSGLGYCFEDFLRTLTDMRNEVIIKDSLMSESIRRPDVDMEFTCWDDKGPSQSIAGKIRLYETGFVIIPHQGEIRRVPYGDVTNVVEEGLGVRVTTELGEQFLFQKMGSEFGPFLNEFMNSYNGLQSRTLSSLKSLFPAVDSLLLRKIASVMREGKAVKRVSMDAISTTLWDRLEKTIALAGLNDSFTYLKELARRPEMAVGFKRGLMGDLTREYIWFLAPIYGGHEQGFGNAVAMEAVEASGEESDGKATYFFRIVSRREFEAFRTPEQLDGVVDKLIRTINRCMLDINFRREPIYLPEEKLEEPDYVKYKHALRRIPSLQLLRSLYIGRVIHSSPEQWKSDVMELLRFNTSTQDDSTRWKKQ